VPVYFKLVITSYHIAFGTDADVNLIEGGRWALGGKLGYMFGAAQVYGPDHKMVDVGNGPGRQRHKCLVQTLVQWKEEFERAKHVKHKRGSSVQQKVLCIRCPLFAFCGTQTRVADRACVSEVTEMTDRAVKGATPKSVLVNSL